MASTARQMPSDEAWESHKATIRTLYVAEELSLARLIQAMSQLGLHATKSQMETKLKQWNFRRNVTRAAWQYVGHQSSKRKRRGEDIDVILSGVRIKRSKVYRQIDRNQPTTQERLNMQASSPRPPDDLPVIVCSPASPSLEYSWPSSLPWLQFLRFHDTNHTTFPLLPSVKLSSLSADISSDLIRTGFSLGTINKTPSLSSVSRLAQTIGVFMPEAYSGENLARAEILYHGPAQDRLQELLKGLIVRMSNNLIHHDVSKFLPLFNHLLRNGFHISNISASQDVTIRSLFDNLFRSALKWSRHNAFSTRTDPEQYFLSDTAFTTVKCLLESGTDPDRLLQYDGATITPLQWAILNGQQNLVQLLADYGATISLRSNGEARSPLRLAIEASREIKRDIVFFLHSKGARVSENEVPIILFTIVQHGDLEIFNLFENDLIGFVGFHFQKHTASSLIPFDTILTASFANRERKGQELVMLLLQAVTRSVCRSLTTSMAMPSSFLVDSLILAVDNEYHDVIRYLIEQGADLNLPNGYGFTPLQVAVARASDATVMFLLSLGAILHGRDPDNLTLVHLAVLRVQPAVLTYILKHGSMDDVNAKLTRDGELRIKLLIRGWVGEKLGEYHEHDKVTPLHLLTRIWRPIHSSINELHARRQCFFYALVEAGANFCGCEILEAAKSGDMEWLQLLLNVGANPNSMELCDNKRGYEKSCLQAALELKELGAASALVQAGARVSCDNLVAALEQGAWQLVMQMRDYGLEVSQIAPDEASRLLETAIRYGIEPAIDWVFTIPSLIYNGKICIAAVFNAINTADEAIVEKLLRYRPENFADDAIQEVAALSIAVEKGSKKLIVTLLSHLPFLDLCKLGHPKSRWDKIEWNSTKYPIELGLILNPNSPSRGNPLTAAILRQDLEIFTLLWDAGYRADTRTLSTAVRMKLVDIVAILLKGPICLEDGDSLNPIVDAVQNKDHRMVQTLIEAGFDVDGDDLRDTGGKDWDFGWEGTYGELFTPLEYAINTGDMELINMLVKSGASLNRERTEDQLDTPLQDVCRGEDLEIVNIFLKAGADVNAEAGTELGVTALQCAVLKKNLDLMSVLLEAGADVNGSPSLYGGATALQYAAIGGALGIARLLLELETPAKINAHRAVWRGRTALEGAAEHGRIDMVQFLLSEGARTTGTGQRQFLRAIKLAEREGHYGVVSILRSHRDWTDADEHRYQQDTSLLRCNLKRNIPGYPHIREEEEHDHDGVCESECSDSDCDFPHIFCGWVGSENTSSTGGRGQQMPELWP